VRRHHPALASALLGLAFTGCLSIFGNYQVQPGGSGGASSTTGKGGASTVTSGGGAAGEGGAGGKGGMAGAVGMGGASSTTGMGGGTTTTGMGGKTSTTTGMGGGTTTTGMGGGTTTTGMGGGTTTTGAGGSDAGCMDADVTGIPDSVDAQAPCSGDLSNVGMGDFRISFTLKTTQSGANPGFALTNQRSDCQGGDFWDIVIDQGGVVGFEIDNYPDDAGNSDDLGINSGVDVTDGAAHQVVIQRVSSTLTIYVDGTPVNASSCAINLVQLPPLETGTSPCVNFNGNGFAAFDGCLGTLADLCVTTSTLTLPPYDGGC
jgi:hypothetical protein